MIAGLARVGTVSAVTTPNATDQPLTTEPVKGARRQANRHLDRLLSPGKDPADPTGRAWLAPAEVPAEVRARVAALVGAYRQHQLGRPDVANRVCQNSVDSEVVKLTQFLLFAGVREPDTDPADYTIELIHRYRGELSKLGAKANTTNAALAALRKFFDHILAPEAVNPARAVTFARTTQKGGRRTVYTRGQADAILAAAEAATTGARPRSGQPLKDYLGAWADYAVTALLAYTGAESGALLRARVGDLDVAGRAITWRDSHDRPTYTQPLPDQLVTILAGYLAAARPTAGPGGPLVTNPRARGVAGGPMRDQALLELTRLVTVAAGVGTGRGRGQDHTPSRWRDTYVSRVARAPHGSLLTVKVLLGLQELASTGTYASLEVANKTVSINDAHAGLVAPAGLFTQHWPHAQLSLAAAAAPTARAGKGPVPLRRARVQVRDLAATGINPADRATLLAAELSFPGHLGGQGKGRETQSAYQLEALYLRAWLESQSPGAADPRRATGGQLLAYLEHLAAAGASVGTRRRTTSALRAYYSYLTILDPALANPTRVLPSLAEVVTEAATHTEADVAAVLACAWAAATDARQRRDKTAWLLARRDHALLATLAFGATRRNETRALATLDVDADAHQLTLHGKGGASRTITIPNVLADILAAYLRDVRPDFPDNPYLFTDRVSAGADTDEHGNARPRLGKEVLRRICYHYGTLAGVAGPSSPHSYRHSAASRQHVAGVSISDISAYLGHRSTLITLRYIHINEGFLHAVLAEAFPPAAVSLPVLLSAEAG